MKRFMLFLTIGFIVFSSSLCSVAQARVDSTIEKSFKTSAPPIDIAASVDGKWIYVLAEKGKLLIYSNTGTLDETIDVDPAMDKIATSGLQVAGMENKVYLSSSRTGTVQEILLNFIVNINTSDAPFIGPENAPVTLVEFSDFQCPYCSSMGPLIEKITEMYPERLKVVFKQFPLPFHKMATPAAMASLAAQQQGKFWQYHDLLFENHLQLSQEKFIEFARQLHLDVDKFTEDMKSKAIQQKLSQDILDGRRAGVRGTPSLFINGRILRQHTVEAMKKMIDQELARVKNADK